LTLIIVPVVYAIFDSISRRFGKKKTLDYARMINEPHKGEVKTHKNPIPSDPVLAD